MLEVDKSSKAKNKAENSTNSKILRDPVNRFICNEIRDENAIKFALIWLEAFIIFSVAWTFGSVFNDQGKRELDQKIREKIICNKTDYLTHTKLRKKTL